MKIDYQYRKHEDGYDQGCDRCGTQVCMTAPFSAESMMNDRRENSEVVMIDGKPYQFYCPFCAETTAIGNVLEYKSLYNQSATAKDVAKGLAQGFNVLLNLLKESK